MTELSYKECERKHIESFMKDFKDLLRKYNAVYKSNRFGEVPQIMFMGIPNGEGDAYMSAVMFDLPDTTTTE